MKDKNKIIKFSMLVTCFIALSCEKDKRVSEQKEISRIQTKLKIDKYHEPLSLIDIDGCEYYFADWGNRAFLTHKGNCKNPLHERQMSMTEAHIERILVKEVKALGGKAVKMIPTYEAGIPDRLVLFRGYAIFVELKRAGLKPKALQLRYMEELNRMGFHTEVIDSVEKIKEFLNYLQKL
jgi:hypothetical protein